MTQKMIRLAAMAALALGMVSAPALALGNKVTGAGASVYPPNTLFSGVTVRGIQFGFGVRVPGNGTAVGQFEVTLLGISILGREQDIEVVGQAATGSATTGSTSTFSGSVAVDLGNGTPPLTGVPFTFTIVTNAAGQGSVTLVLGATTFPVSTVTEGSMTIK
jgi:hypothetical protein